MCRVLTTNLELLTDSIMANWKPEKYDRQILSLTNPPEVGQKG